MFGPEILIRYPAPDDRENAYRSNHVFVHGLQNVVPRQHNRYKNLLLKAFNFLMLR